VISRLPLLLCLTLSLPIAQAASEISDTLSVLPTSTVGMELGTLKVGVRTFSEVRVKSSDAKRVVFTHKDGLASVLLRDLTSELQQQFGYDAALDAPVPPLAARLTPLPSARKPLPAAYSKEVAAGAISDLLDTLIFSFGKTPELRRIQSHRGDFSLYSPSTKSQGQQASCAIFAVVSALEFQNGIATGRPEKLSEDYLVWATRRLSGVETSRLAITKTPASANRPELVTTAEDLGFSLVEVISAIRAYGIATQAEVPTRYPSKLATPPPPSDEVIATARTRRHVEIVIVPGRQPELLINNIIQSLNQGRAVPLGLEWPHDSTLITGNLSDQTPVPNKPHAVTLVGYECSTGRIEDTVFIFKNSYGPRWGQGGYGRVTWNYLVKNILSAYVLEACLDS